MTDILDTNTSLSSPPDVTEMSRRRITFKANPRVSPEGTERREDSEDPKVTEETRPLFLSPSLTQAQLPSAYGVVSHEKTNEEGYARLIKLPNKYARGTETSSNFNPDIDFLEGSDVDEYLNIKSDFNWKYKKILKNDQKLEAQGKSSYDQEDEPLPRESFNGVVDEPFFETSSAIPTKDTESSIEAEQRERTSEDTTFDELRLLRSEGKTKFSVAYETMEATFFLYEALYKNIKDIKLPQDHKKKQCDEESDDSNAEQEPKAQAEVSISKNDNHKKVIRIIKKDEVVSSPPDNTRGYKKIKKVYIKLKDLSPEQQKEHKKQQIKAAKERYKNTTKGIEAKSQENKRYYQKKKLLPKDLNKSQTSIDKMVSENEK